METRNTNHLYKELLNQSQKIAVVITNKVGTMGFFLLVFLWTVSWLSWNTLAPVEWRFDPYPAFVFWLFISNVIQIFLMPLIMIGQNLQGKHAEIRAENDYKINVKAEKEIAELKQELKEIKSLLLQQMTNK
ncbi:MAG: hypothetical protein RL264_1848 [Bacteroidota bacterium]|jgi:uncharacterized membrane protein